MTRVFDDTNAVCLNVEVNLNTPRMESKAIPKGNGPFLHYAYGSGGLTMEGIFRIAAEELVKRFDRCVCHFNQRFEDTEKKKNQSLAELQHQAQQPRLALKVDLKTDKKTRKRTEGAAADNDRHEDISSARAEDGPTSLTSFRNIA